MKKSNKTTKATQPTKAAARPVYAPVSNELTAYGEKRYRTPIRANEFTGTTGSRTKAVILDIDGTIETYGAGLNSKLEPWLEKHYKAGDTFVVITARDEWMYETSFNSMMRILPYPFVGPFMRAADDPRYAAEFKRELAETLSAVYEFVGAADDDYFVLKMWKQWAIEKFEDPKDFDIFEAGYGSYKDWRKDLPRKGGYGRTYGGTTWTGYDNAKNRPAGTSSYIWDKDPVDGEWKRTSEFLPVGTPLRDDDEFDDLSTSTLEERDNRVQVRLDLEDDVLASYPDLTMHDVVLMDSEELEKLKDAALRLPLDVEVVPPMAETVEKLNALYAEYGEKPRKNRVLTEELLAEVAAAYLNAPLGGRQAAAGKVLGIDGHRASYYINAARKRGLLDPPTGDMRFEEIA